MRNHDEKVSEQKLNDMSPEQAANVLMKMTPKEAERILSSMDENRYFLVQKEIFDKNFQFHGDIMAETFVKALNAAVLRK